MTVTVRNSVRKWFDIVACYFFLLFLVHSFYILSTRTSSSNLFWYIHRLNSHFSYTYAKESIIIIQQDASVVLPSNSLSHTFFLSISLPLLLSTCQCVICLFLVWLSRSNRFLCAIRHFTMKSIKQCLICNERSKWKYIKFIFRLIFQLTRMKRMRTPNCHIIWSDKNEINSIQWSKFEDFGIGKSHFIRLKYTLLSFTVEKIPLKFLSAQKRRKRNSISQILKSFTSWPGNLFKIYNIHKYTDYLAIYQLDA